MLDQSFSAENFFRIFHIENRKGTFKKEILSSEYLNAHAEVLQYLLQRSTVPKEEFDVHLDELNETKREALNKYLQKVSDDCNAKSFCFKIDSFEQNGKSIYTVNTDAASFFAMKQLQYNISRTFKVKQSNRYDIVKQLKTLLEDGFPKVFIRIDIKGFYENIGQKKLFQRIDENQLLNFFSKKILKQLIYDYEAQKDKSIFKAEFGIPRGVGVSAYLAELFMRDIDKQIKQISDVVYYARYVDDIAIVLIPKSKYMLPDYYHEIDAIIKSFDLELKDGSDGGENKSLNLNLMQPSVASIFDFLGYKFIIEQSKLKELRLSGNKMSKYEARLKISVEQYNKNSKYNEKQARKLLFKRLAFLTGNFHLLNNKKRIKGGIYYSNSLIDKNNMDTGEFRHMDNLIRKHISKLKPNANLQVDVERLKKRILYKYSFKKGFYNRKEAFHKFRKEQFQNIISAWK